MWDPTRSTVHTMLTEHFGMQRVCARGVPRSITYQNKENRFSTSRSFLRKWRSGGDAFMNRIFTTDGMWLYCYNSETKHQSSVWKKVDSSPPKKAKVCKSMGKKMYIMFIDRQGMILTNAVPKEKTVNSEYYSKVLRRDLINGMRKKRSALKENFESIIHHQDNVSAHTAATTKLEVLDHPPYNPDLARTFQFFFS